MEITYTPYKPVQIASAALAALPINSMIGEVGVGVRVTYARNLTAQEQATAQSAYDAAAASVTEWTLSASGNTVDSPVTVTGYDAPAICTVAVNGERLATENDDSAPYEVVFTPTAAGTYMIYVQAQDGSKSGEITVEVS